MVGLREPLLQASRATWEVCSWGPWFFLLLLLSQAVVVPACFHLKLTFLCQQFYVAYNTHTRAPPS